MTAILAKQGFVILITLAEKPGIQTLLYLCHGRREIFFIDHVLYVGKVLVR